MTFIQLFNSIRDEFEEIYAPLIEDYHELKSDARSVIQEMMPWTIDEILSMYIEDGIDFLCPLVYGYPSWKGSSWSTPLWIILKQQIEYHMHERLVIRYIDEYE